MDVDSAAITQRLRTRFAEVQGRVVELPLTVRSTAQRLVEKLRLALDLPSRSELAELTQRLEALDRRIGDLATHKVQELSRIVPSLPAPSAETIAADAALAAEPATEAVSEPATEAVVEAAVQVEPAAEPVAEVEAAAEPAAEAGSEPATEAAQDGGKERRRNKSGRRNTANKTSRR